MRPGRGWVALTVFLLSHACERAATNRDEAPAQAAGEAGQAQAAGQAHEAGGTAAQGGLNSQAGEPSTTGGTAQQGGIAEGGDGPTEIGGAAGGGDAMAGAASTLELVCHDGGLGEGATCQSYCEAWFPTCKVNATTTDIFLDATDCQEQCAGFTEEQLCCRGYHVANAPDKPTSHCPHAAGIRICP